MNTESEIPPTENHPNVVAGILKRIGTIAIFIVLTQAILLLAAGRLNWTWAWVYLGICLVSVLITAPIMLRTSLETIAERGELKMTKKWLCLPACQLPDAQLFITFECIRNHVKIIENARGRELADEMAKFKSEL